MPCPSCTSLAPLLTLLPIQLHMHFIDYLLIRRPRSAPGSMPAFTFNCFARSTGPSSQCFEPPTNCCTKCHASLACCTKTRTNKCIQRSIYICSRHDDCMFFLAPTLHWTRFPFADALPYM